MSISRRAARRAKGKGKKDKGDTEADAGEGGVKGGDSNPDTLIAEGEKNAKKVQRIQELQDEEQHDKLQQKLLEREKKKVQDDKYSLCLQKLQLSPLLCYHHRAKRAKRTRKRVRRRRKKRKARKETKGRRMMMMTMRRKTRLGK